MITLVMMFLVAGQWQTFEAVVPDCHAILYARATSGAVKNQSEIFYCKVTK